MSKNELINQVVQEVIEVLTSQENKFRHKEKLLLVGKPPSKNQDFIILLKKKWHVIPCEFNGQELKGIKRVLFLNATQDTIVKAALGIEDTHESKLISTLFWESIPVSIIPSIYLQENLIKNKTSNNPYFRMFSKYIETLEKYGVEMETYDSFAEEESNFSNSNSVVQHEKKLVTQKDIQKIVGKDIVISKNTIVTPLARDAARDLGIKLKYSTN